jgi:hypothetical protein
VRVIHVAGKWAGEGYTCSKQKSNDDEATLKCEAISARQKEGHSCNFVAENKLIISFLILLQGRIDLPKVESIELSQLASYCPCVLSVLVVRIS